MDSEITSTKEHLNLIEVPAHLEKSQRIDLFLSQHLIELSRSRIQSLIDEGYVTINDILCDNKKNLIKAGDRIQLITPASVALDIVAQEIPLEVLYEDEHLIVINKPAGLVVHPAAGHSDGTLVNALLAHCQELSGINGTQRPGIVHRLDKDTSGAMVVAKNDRAHQDLQAQIQAKTARREYLGIVRGVPKSESGIVDAAIARHKSDRKKMAVVEDGRKAITHWQIKERLGNYTLVKFDLETGRTHQIRVHSAYMGWAIAGDPIYGYPNKETSQYLAGQALHAWKLTFTHPVSGDIITNIAPLPIGFEKLLTFLRRRK
ncbi:MULTISPECIES: RluA family pseudouridine synthase [Pseudanabaena]|uniref:Pseudouridine synthase n=2 Tax=Pseudanabaena TaxID=1152 RepID=L8N238_9CYAN|nr:RluA family pseudouridine synthase [Pseudanabaena catenata]ELS33159.1 ribosomal large subunit pseudouridine synthase D [Pseudanabaena biceps PCC 7429]MDG3494635.1 RluA family pseudouridine synthase [Pseudanabaena catenata USMAC16]